MATPKCSPKVGCVAETGRAGDLGNGLVGLSEQQRSLRESHTQIGLGGILPDVAFEATFETSPAYSDAARNFLNAERRRDVLRHVRQSLLDRGIRGLEVDRDGRLRLFSMKRLVDHHDLKALASGAEPDVLFDEMRRQMG
jgi:hypothetical protein